VYVIVYTSPSGYENVYLGFPHAVADEQARRLIQQAARLGGWTATELRVKTEPFVSYYDAQSEKPVQGREQTIASCVMAGPVDHVNGWFRIEPFVRALAHYPRVHIAFLVDVAFPFQGPRSFGNAAVKVTEHLPPPVPTPEQGQPEVQQVTYSYDIRVSDSNLPASAFPKQARGQGQGANHRGANYLLIALVAALIAAAAGMALYLQRMRKQATAPGRTGDDAQTGSK